MGHGAHDSGKGACVLYDANLACVAKHEIAAAAAPLNSFDYVHSSKTHTNYTLSNPTQTWHHHSLAL